ncbi:MAG: sigma-70 family RNA polymerase sigma factor [Bacteroidota bacterium]|nr:sigma-70 family RNA polymerase sigma factor [Bacteroidota bacterium]
MYTRYCGRVLRYCARLLKDTQAAEDAVQNVFVKLHAGRASIRNGQSLQSWVFTVARNEAFEELRRRKGELLSEEIVWEGVLPDEELSKKNRREAIESVLNALYPSFREIIILREYEQLSYDEIAQVTNTTVSSVKSRLFKARKALIEKLKPYLDEREL